MKFDDLSMYRGVEISGENICIKNEKGNKYVMCVKWFE